MSISSPKAILLSLLCFALSVVADTNSSDEGYPNDPVLQYRPNFARSLPVQILVTGIVLTLVSVLLIHLIFTYQYHWTLAQVNYILQLSGVSTLLISLVATLHVVLAQSVEESMQWPYMLSYIAVDTPPLEDDNSSWNTIEQATWLVMNATTAGFIQITHIHFLTLLFPSRLEAKLIYGLLGPLALVSAICQLLPIRAIGSATLPANASLIYHTDAIRNICNATLSFLFTSSLFLYACLINWRMDGGTAAFGVGALTLAVLSTTLQVVYIPTEDQYAWLPGLMWAVVVWQSFFGWWWWVGAGMGVGEVDELLKREERRERRRKAKKEKREAQKERARVVWKGVTGAFRYRGKDGERKESEGEEDEFEEGAEGDGTAVQKSDSSIKTGTTTTTSSSPYLHRIRNSRAGRYMHTWFGTLRIAHLTAARDQAVERVERIQQVYRRDEVGRDDGGRGAGVFQAYPSRQDLDDDERTLHEAPIGDAPPPPRVEAAIAEEQLQPSSFWWWGPLRRWRLQDATAY